MNGPEIKGVFLSMVFIAGCFAVALAVVGVVQLAARALERDFAAMTMRAAVVDAAAAEGVDYVSVEDGELYRSPQFVIDGVAVPVLSGPTRLVDLRVDPDVEVWRCRLVAP